MPVFVVPHPAAIEHLKHEEWFRSHMQRIGETIVGISRTTAPRSLIHRAPPQGHGADSIHAVIEETFDGWHTKVGWDQAHSYMAFTKSHAIQEATVAVVGR